MFKWLQRLFNIGKSKVKTATENLEGPLSIIQKGLRELREDLNRGIKSMAEIRGMAISAEYNRKEKLKLASEYENRAFQHLKKGKEGIITAVEADKLASEDLIR